MTRKPSLFTVDCGAPGCDWSRVALRRRYRQILLDQHWAVCPFNRKGRHAKRS